MKAPTELRGIRSLLISAVCVTAITCVVPTSPTQPARFTEAQTSAGNGTRSVSVTLRSPSIKVGETTRATASMDKRSGTWQPRRVVWESSNTSIATVHWSRGVVVGVAAGSAEIRAKVNGVSGSTIVTVESPSASVGSVTVVLESSTIDIGGVTSSTATAFDASGDVLNGRTTEWSSSNPAIATVTSTGVVKIGRAHV